MLDPFGILGPEKQQRSRPTFSPKEKEALYKEQKGKCKGCEKKFPIRNMTVDHIKAFSKGGSDRLNNLQLLCGSCNSMKGKGTMSELKKKLRQQGIIKGNTTATKKPATKPHSPQKKKRQTRRTREEDPFRILFG